MNSLLITVVAALCLSGAPNHKHDLQTLRLGTGVELVMFGAVWCQPCRDMIPVLRELRWEGYAVWYAKAEESPNRGILEAQELRVLPAWVLYWHRKPVARTEGKLPKGFIIEWIGREQRARGLADQSRRDPLDVKFLRENHWRLAPGSCGMAGCQIHGGGWVLEGAP